MSESHSQEPNWIVRGGIATAKQLRAGTGKHLGMPDVPGLFGFSVQYQPGRAIPELAAAGRFRNAQISIAAEDALIAAGIQAGYAIRIVKSPGTGYHHTVQAPFPLPLDLAIALSGVFTQIPNPARLIGP